ncbi:MAG: hypothetical protein ACLQVF_34075 [Isosphaeraceae bacterium]
MLLLAARIRHSGAFSVMDNHLHVLVRLDPQVAAGWSGEFEPGGGGGIAVADSPSDSDGKFLRRAGYVKRHCVDVFPLCLSFNLLPSFVLSDASARRKLARAAALETPALTAATASIPDPLSLHPEMQVE